MDMNSNLDTNSYIYMMNTLDLGSYIDIAVDTAISSVYSSGDGSGGGFSSGGGGGRRRRWRRRTLNLS